MACLYRQIIRAEMQFANRGDVKVCVLITVSTQPAVITPQQSIPASAPEPLRSQESLLFATRLHKDSWRFVGVCVGVCVRWHTSCVSCLLKDDTHTGPFTSPSWGQRIKWPIWANLEHLQRLMFIWHLHDIKLDLCWLAVNDHSHRALASSIQETEEK